MHEIKKQSKKVCSLFIVLTLVFATLSAFLGYKLSRVQNALTTEISTTDVLILEKQNLLQQLESIQLEYDQLRLEYEGLGDLFEKEQKKIETLITQLKNEKGSVAIYKKQVEMFKMQLRDYLSQIETLQSRNQELNEENIKVKTALDSTIYHKSLLESENINLSEKVEQGSMLKAYEIISDGVRLKNSGEEIPTHRARRVKRLRTCFILSENYLAEKGEKVVYLRIADPNGNIMHKGTSANNMFQYNGDMIVWSVKGHIKYEGKAMDLCFYWDHNEGKLLNGIYAVDIFIDDYHIGTSKFELN